MPNLTPIEPDQATGKTRELYDYIQTNAGRIPNLFRLMANSPVALKAYLDFSAAMRQSGLPKGLPELVGVTVTAACRAEYTAIGAAACPWRRVRRGRDHRGAVRPLVRSQDRRGPGLRPEGG